MDLLDEKITDLLSTVEQSLSCCCLNHNDSKTYPAVASLCQNINLNLIDGCIQVRLPICQDCMEALEDTNWILCYCVTCHSSQWIYRPQAKRKYPSGNIIFWMGECPKCTNIGFHDA